MENEKGIVGWCNAWNGWFETEDVEGDEKMTPAKKSKGDKKGLVQKYITIKDSKHCLF